MPKTVVLGVTGGIAAYKACEVARILRKDGFDVRVVMTRNACEFVTPLTFEALTGNPVARSMFDSPVKWEVEHIALAKRADLMLIAPATANIIAKLANGIADDMLSSVALATRAPILIAPAMNTGMYQNAATQENIERLRRRGVEFVGPDTGTLANGDSGEGRMSTPASIALAARLLLAGEKDFKGKKVLVTAGATSEKLDPVRYITNKSSGKMGFALAEAAMARGARVTIVMGNTQLEPPPVFETLRVETTMQLFQTLIERSPEFDIIIQAAAPCDFRPAEQSGGKIKKRDGQPLVLDLVENPDVAAALGMRKRDGQILVTFSAETDNVIENSREKMKRKNADLMVANDVSAEGAGFNVDTNIVTLITRDTVEAHPIMSKIEVANVILGKVKEIAGM